MSDDFDYVEALKKTIQQQTDLIETQNQFNQIIGTQHRIMLDVLRKYQRSRWPWVRWVANDMHLEMMYHIAVAEKSKGK